MKKIGKMWLHTAQPLLTVGRLCCDIVKSENGMKKVKMKKRENEKNRENVAPHCTTPFDRRTVVPPLSGDRKAAS